MATDTKGDAERHSQNLEACTVISRYWEFQAERDYPSMTASFARDAVLIDPILGAIEGRDAISDYIDKVKIEIDRIEAVFSLSEVAGSGDVAWAQWTVTTTRGQRKGCGIYRVRDGEITYYRDYMNSKEFEGRG